MSRTQQQHDEQLDSRGLAEWDGSSFDPNRTIQVPVGIFVHRPPTKRARLINGMKLVIQDLDTTS